MRTFAPALLLLASCGVSEKTFSDQYAAALCDVIFKCEDEFASYISYFDDKDECRTRFEAYADDYQDYYESSCTFDKKKAAECIREVRKLTKDCGSAYTDGVYDPACGQVWVCN